VSGNVWVDSCCGWRCAFDKIAPPDSRRRSCIVRRTGNGDARLVTALRGPAPPELCSPVKKSPSYFRMIPSSTNAAQGRRKSEEAELFERRSSRGFIRKNSRLERTRDADAGVDARLDEVGTRLAAQTAAHVADEPKNEAHAQ